MFTEERLKEILAGHGLEILGVGVGQGGSAVVHKAMVKDTGTGLGLPPGALVAVKEYRDSVLTIPTQLERIRSEAKVGATVKQRNLVDIHGLLEPDKEPPLLVMEWVDGTPLLNWVPQRASVISWDELVPIVEGILDGLEALHNQGAKHRDLKPENIFLVGEDRPVIMDMGIVEYVDNNNHTLHTTVKDFLGTVRYSSPQFLRGEAFDEADDIYSLGATLYFIVQGQEIYADVERKPLLAHQVLSTSPHVSSLPENLPSTLQLLIEGALNRDRRRRPTITELREYLEHPLDASYVKKEREARNREARGFEVILVQDDGATVFVDLLGRTPPGGSYVVVRELPQVGVPSLDDKVKPEKWIADVEFKHHYNGVGHFAVQGKRWESGKPGAISPSVDLFGTPGRWVEFDKKTDKVKVGDRVVRSD